MWHPYIDFTMVKTLLTNLVSTICNIFVAEAVNAGKTEKFRQEFKQKEISEIWGRRQLYGDVMQVTFAILDFHDGRKTLKLIVKTWTEPVDCCLINLKK